MRVFQTSIMALCSNSNLRRPTSFFIEMTHRACRYGLLSCEDPKDALFFQVYMDRARVFPPRSTRAPTLCGLFLDAKHTLDFFPPFGDARRGHWCPARHQSE